MWQPIETAPNDIALVFDGNGIFVAVPVPFQGKTKWVSGFIAGPLKINFELEATHWMPLPEPPTA
jgi:hypothetical protein